MSGGEDPARAGVPFHRLALESGGGQRCAAPGAFHDAPGGDLGDEDILDEDLDVFLDAIARDAMRVVLAAIALGALAAGAMLAIVLGYLP